MLVSGITKEGWVGPGVVWLEHRGESFPMTFTLVSPGVDVQSEMSLIEQYALHH